MSNIEKQHEDMVDCPEHAQHVSDQIVSSPTSHVEPALHKASTKMLDLLIAKHGRTKAEQIIAAESDRALRQQIFKPTSVALGVDRALHDPESKHFDREVEETVQ